MKRDTYLALDFGGTKLLVGEVDDQGQVLNYKKYNTGYVDQLQALDIIKHSIDDYMDNTGNGWENHPKSMGIGLVGRVDNANGIWFQIDHDRKHEMPLAEILMEQYKIPCFIDNDVKSATKAEKLRGYGGQSDNFIYLNVGTGIAAGTVINGRLVRGSHCNAGEVGHTNVGVSIGIKCGCGRMDCVELIASGTGFDKSARVLKACYPTQLSIPDENNRVDVREIYKLSKQGDELCKKLVDQAADALANLIMNLVRVSDPDMIILGGGIVSDGYLYSEMLKKMNQTTIRFVTNGIVLTELDPNMIGFIGAGAVAMNIL